jgi:hypothetical protein
LDNCLIEQDEPDQIAPLPCKSLHHFGILQVVVVSRETASWVTELLLGITILISILICAVVGIFVRQQLYFNQYREVESYGAMGTYTEIK